MEDDVPWHPMESSLLLCVLFVHHLSSHLTSYPCCKVFIGNLSRLTNGVTLSKACASIVFLLDVGLDAGDTLSVATRSRRR